MVRLQIDLYGIGYQIRRLVRCVGRHALNHFSAAPRRRGTCGTPTRSADLNDLLNLALHPPAATGAPPRRAGDPGGRRPRRPRAADRARSARRCATPRWCCTTSWWAARSSTCCRPTPTASTSASTPATTLPQEQIIRLLLNLARAGRPVLWLKGGDPTSSAAAAEEALALAEAGIPFEVVPASARRKGASALAGMPLTHRDRAQALVFATRPPARRRPRPGPRSTSTGSCWRGRARPW